MKRKAIFIWVPKTAGTSLWDAIWHSVPCATKVAPEKRVGHTVKRMFNGCDICTFRHYSLDALVRAHVLSDDQIKRRFIFAFVRNPWARMVSLYYYTKRHHKGRPGWKKWGSFSEFVHHVCRASIPPVGFYDDLRLSITNKQSAWMTYRGKNVADFVGHVETINKDWKKICRTLDIPRRPLKKLNRQRHHDFRTHYTLPLWDMVTQKYSSDIEQFGYDPRSLYDG